MVRKTTAVPRSCMGGRLLIPPLCIRRGMRGSSATGIISIGLQYYCPHLHGARLVDGSGGGVHFTPRRPLAPSPDPRFKSKYCKAPLLLRVSPGTDSSLHSGRSVSSAGHLPLPTAHFCKSRISAGIAAEEASCAGRTGETRKDDHIYRSFWERDERIM